MKDLAMPTRDELGDLLSVPNTPRFSPFEANTALTATYIALSAPEELAIVWEILREGFARGWAAYYTAAGGDRGLRIGLRAAGRRAEFIVAKLHMTSHGIKFSSSPSFGKHNRKKILGPDGGRSQDLDAFLTAIPAIRRVGPFLGSGYDHARILGAADGLLPRHHPPGRARPDDRRVPPSA